MVWRPAVWRRMLRLGALVALMLVAFFAAPVDTNVHPDNVVRAIVSLLVLALLAAGMTWLLRVHVEDEQRRVDGLVLGIVLVVVFFAFGFYLMEIHHPGQVSGLQTRVDALYYAVSTLATIGYGDVHAVGQAARVLVLVQVVFDFVFVAAAASLLTTHLRTAAQQRAQELAADPQARRTQRKPR